MATAVQNVTAVDAGSATITIGSGQGWNSPTAGNWIVAWYNGDFTCSTPTGFTASVNVVDGNGVYFWYKQAAGTETSIAFVQSGTSDGTCGLIEISGVTAFDVANNSPATQSNGTSSPSVSVTTTGTFGSFIVALAGLHNSASTSAPTAPSWSNSFTNIVNIGSGTPVAGQPNTYTHSFVGTRETTGTGAVATVASWTNSMGDRQELVIAFKLAAPAGVSGGSIWIPPRRAPIRPGFNFGLPMFSLPTFRSGPEYVAPPSTGIVTIDASSPASSNSTGTTTTSTSFTPTANSLLVALVGYGEVSLTPSATVTDSLGSTWARKKLQNTSSDGGAEIWMMDVGPSPAARSITATLSSGGAGVVLTPLVLTDALAVASQTATPVGFSNTAMQTSITTTTAGSLVVGAIGYNGNQITLLENGNTTSITEISDATNGEAYATFRATSNVTTPGAITLGYTNTGTVQAELAMMEILPSAATAVTPFIGWGWGVNV